MKKIAWLLLIAGCGPQLRWLDQIPPQSSSGEFHLANIRQLTVDGTHAEAYWSPDGKRIILQAAREGDKADQVYVVDLASGEMKRVSNGKGKCT